jgi:tripartite-type tricarboxylate transporter receptor subunit TctC
MNIPSNRRRFLVGTLAGACAIATPAFAFAQAEWQPTKPVRIIVPFAPGVSPDVVARLVADPLAQALHQPVIVDNRPGAAGIIGADAAAKSAPDGSTLFLTVNSIMGINPNVYTKLPYDTFRDFVPVTQVVLVPYLLVIGPNQPFSSLKDLLAKAKADPGKIDYGSLGVGSGPHVVMEMMNNMAGVKMNHVPYKSSAVTDVIAGQISMTFDPTTTAVPMVRAGKLRALAVTSKNRIPQLPDVPTVAEVLPGYDGDGWQGFYLPAGTPKEIVARYHKEIVKVLQRPEVRSKLIDLGLQPVGSSPEEFALVSRREVEKWGRIARQNNIRVE